MIQAGTGQDGFNPIDWPDAKTLTDSYNSGDSTASARMYVVLSAEMEDAVYAGLESMGLTVLMALGFGLDCIKTLKIPAMSNQEMHLKTMEAGNGLMVPI